MTTTRSTLNVTSVPREEVLVRVPTTTTRSRLVEIALECGLIVATELLAGANLRTLSWVYASCAAA